MPEREQPGVAEQQIEAERGDRQGKAVGQELRLISPGKGWKGKQYGNDGRDKRCAAAVGRRTRSVQAFLPKRPVGRMRSTTAAMR